jgi:hypothetical protein
LYNFKLYKKKKGINLKFIILLKIGCTEWHVPVIPGLGRQKLEDHKFQANQGYTFLRLSQKERRKIIILWDSST